MIRIHSAGVDEVLAIMINLITVILLTVVDLMCRMNKSDRDGWCCTERSSFANSCTANQRPSQCYNATAAAATSQVGLTVRIQYRLPHRPGPIIYKALWYPVTL